MGLDVSASSVKLVELEQVRAGRYRVERCGLEPLERGWINEGAIEKLDEVADATRRLIARTGTKTKQVVMALPISAVISKKIVLPDGLSERELEVQVETEANQYIPFPLDEVSLDFCVAGPSASSVGDVDVAIAATRKEKVEERQALAEACGLTLEVLDVDSYAARLAASHVIDRLPGGSRDLVVALFEIGAFNTSMQVLRNDELLFEREQVFGGAQLTQMLVRQYGFTQEEAESKKRSGELPADFAQTVLPTFLESSAQEIERALRFFFTSTPNNKVDYILLAGGAANVPGLPEVVTKHTSFPCQVVNPFVDMDIGKAVREREMMRNASSYLTACGLAMRRYLR